MGACLCLYHILAIPLINVILLWIIYQFNCFLATQSLGKCWHCTFHQNPGYITFAHYYVVDMFKTSIQ